jgi:phosphoribosylformylglycinamidine synthase
MTAKVFVTLKKGGLDPQGKAVEQSLARLGFSEAREVRVGRFIEMAVEAGSREEATKRIEDRGQVLNGAYWGRRKSGATAGQPA